MNILWTQRLLLAACGLLAVACVDNTSPDPKIENPGQQPNPAIGASRFVSADGRAGEASRDGNDDSSMNNAAAPELGADDERTVEEGDIYRITTDGKILNLNPYRGLQIIDLADPANPELLGRVQIAGWPVEMYQVGNRVYALLNDWKGYYGSRTDVLPDRYEGGVVVVIDISNPANPVITGRAEVPGYITTSRLTRGNNKEALYVVANEWQGGGQTNVKSFAVSTTGAITEKTTLNLDGSVADIQATGERLIVARHDWRQNGGSDVTVIDISSPDGDMIEGGTVTVNGYVNNKFNMDIHEGVLRVVSGRSWRSTDNTNHVQTFDASDVSNLTPIDAATFGDNEDLFATLFLGEKAFFVTYFRTDPFHAFEITADGMITEKSEYIVSGWNDYFRPVSSERRLIGIGKNDQTGNTMAVSLYDITDLENLTPMIDREEVDLQWSWSEANWDDRAFSVLEKATSVLADTGETETGVVLLPFSGYDSNGYVSAVQIFTFSDTTLTKRGIMEHDTQVRRSFLADATDKTVGNLSDSELALHDASDPDQPQRLGSIDLAPNYTDFLIYGNHGVRRRSNQDYYWWWSPNSNTTAEDDVEIVSLTGDPDSNLALASLQVPMGATLTKVGDRLISTAYIPATTDFEVQVWNLSNPTMPVLEDTRNYDDLNTGYGYSYGYFGDCFRCSYYYGYYGNTAIQVAGDSVVYPESVHKQTLIGTMTYTYTYPDNQMWDSCWDNVTGEPKACTYIDGGRNCSTLTKVNGTVEPTICEGAFYQCSRDIDGETSCVEVPANTITTRSGTYSYEAYRYWTYYNLKILDVSQGTLPDIKTIAMDTTEEAVGLLARDNSLYVSFKKPTTVQGDSRPFVQYFMRQIDLTNPQTPVVKPDVNIPGELVEIDGNTIITRDFLWGANVVESSINKLTRTGNIAVLQNVRRFEDEYVHTVLHDGADHLLITHQAAYNSYSSNVSYDLKLSIIPINTPQFNIVSETVVDSWARLTSAVPGRALFTVSGGLLVLNLNNAAAPFAQAYFGTSGWPQGFEINDRDIYFAAGMFGVYQFDMDATNLLSAP